MQLRLTLLITGSLTRVTHHPDYLRTSLYTNIYSKFLTVTPDGRFNVELVRRKKKEKKGAVYSLRHIGQRGVKNVYIYPIEPLTPNHPPTFLNSFPLSSLLADAVSSARMYISLITQQNPPRTPSLTHQHQSLSKKLPHL